MIELIFEPPVELFGNDEEGYRIIVNNKRAVTLRLKNKIILLKRGNFSLSPKIEITKKDLEKEIAELAQTRKNCELHFSNGEFLKISKKQVQFLKNLLQDN